MQEKRSYKEIWQIIKLIDKSDSTQNLEEINTLVKNYSEKYAEQVELAFVAISQGNKDRLCEWTSLSKGVCALRLCTALSDMKNIPIPEATEILEFFLDEDLDISIKALGIYSVAATIAGSEADLCYELQTKAFAAYPDLASVFGIDYVYDPRLVREQYVEVCPICGSEESNGHYCVPQFTGLKTGSYLAPIKLWKKCHGCGNLYAYNFPVLEMGEMNGHYTRRSSHSVIEPRYGLHIFSEIFNKCKQYTSGDQYLEIGIGSGEMLAAAMEMGYEVDAVEICKEDCEKVSAVLGIDITWCDFMKYTTEKTYDVIVMGDVIEHVSEPIVALKKATSLLNKGGVLWLSTPNFNSGFSRLKKFTDPMWNQKNHFTYFSYETLLPFLEEMGLEVKRYDISNRYNGSMELYCVKN